MASPLAKPARIGKYEVLEVIGRGGMGIVYKAADNRIGRFVAIKMLTAALGEEPELLTRFYNEAKYTGSLQHSNIVTVYELGDQDGYPYLVMEYLEGEGLDSVIANERPLLLGEKLGIIVQVCNGLRFAHARGLVHRDIKPANIVVLKDGTVKIVDFGIAHVRGSRLTRANQIIGSIHYMSPEQLSGTVEVDLRTDIYSTGVVLFQLLTGALPFEGKDTGSTMMKIVHDPPPLIGKFLQISPPELEAINTKALAKDRDERYASVEDFSFDLAHLQQQMNKDVVLEQLRQANAAIEREDFSSAKQQLLRVLQIDRQNAKAAELLRQIQQQTVHVQQRVQQVARMKMKAEEALKEEDFDTALRCIDEALNLDKDNLELANLRTAAQTCRDRAIKYRTKIGEAEANRKSGDLEAADRAAADAIRLQPGSPEGRQLKDAISRQIGQRPQAGVQGTPADLPPRIPAANLPREPQKQKEEKKLPLFSATGSAIPEFTEQIADTGAISDTHPISETRLQNLVDYQQQREEDEQTKPGIPHELLEFLPPDRPRWIKPALYILIAVLLVAGAVYFVRSSGGVLSSASRPEKPAVAAVTTYVEINAEPWGTIKKITTAEGRTVSQDTQQTPMRLTLPPGQYTIAMSGPNGETQTSHVQVPQDGGTSCFITFRKPDLGKILQ